MNHKRGRDDRDGGGNQHHHKKHKSKHNHAPKQYNGQHQPKHPNTPSSSTYQDAVAQLPPPTTFLGHVPAYTPFTVPSGLPPLPDILDPALATAPFRHKSSTTVYNRSSATAIGINTSVTYDQLEFLGDAQIEHLASRLLYTRFPHLLAGQQSQLRELLVKNETLAEFARAYKFEERVQIPDVERMLRDSDGRGNKGFTKILADVFEAYVAAVVLSHGDEGFAVAEKWMTGLWAPKLMDVVRREREGGKFYSPSLHLQHDVDVIDPLKIYNPAAKAELQKKILSGPGVKLEYEPYKPSEELKGDLLGQNRHYIAVYFTGYGYTRRLLGKGEGRNKVEAGNWAATEAMHGEAKAVVEECAAKLEAIREQKRKEREAATVAEEERRAGKADEMSASNAQALCRTDLVKESNNEEKESGSERKKKSRESK